jgi:hypothetical protein
MKDKKKHVERLLSITYKSELLVIEFFFIDTILIMPLILSFFDVFKSFILVESTHVFLACFGGFQLFPSKVASPDLLNLNDEPKSCAMKTESLDFIFIGLLNASATITHSLSILIKFYY